MTVHDLWLLSPELALLGLGLVLIVLDMALPQRWLGRLLPPVTVVGLLVPVGFTMALWREVSAEPTGALVGVFGSIQVDQFALFFKFLVMGIVALIALASSDYVGRFRAFQGEYYALVVLSAGGMTLLATGTELISLYLALEMTALPLAALAAFLRDERSSEAGIKFLLLSATASAFLLYGIAMVYGFTGTTSLREIPLVLGGAGGQVPFGSYAVLLGVVLIVAGFGFKIASVPFQMWVPDVYEGSPTTVTAYLSVASKAAGFAVLLRVFHVAFQGFEVDWSLLFAVLASASMFVGNLVAVAQTNVKRLLGYSTIAQAGYLMVGLAAVARDPAVSGASALMFYLAAYAVTNLAAFFAIIAMTNRTGSDRIEDLAGMWQRAPVVSLVLGLAMVSLIGIPPTAIFIAKLYIFTAAVQSGLVWLAVVGVVNSVLSAYYYLRVVRAVFLMPAPSAEGVPSSGGFRLALGVAALGTLVLGVLPGPLLDVVSYAARTLTGT